MSRRDDDETVVVNAAARAWEGKCVESFNLALFVLSPSLSLSSCTVTLMYSQHWCFGFLDNVFSARRLLVDAIVGCGGGKGYLTVLDWKIERHQTYAHTDKLQCCHREESLTEGVEWKMEHFPCSGTDFTRRDGNKDILSPADSGTIRRHNIVVDDTLLSVWVCLMKSSCTTSMNLRDQNTRRRIHLTL